MRRRSGRWTSESSNVGESVYPTEVHSDKEKFMRHSKMLSSEEAQARASRGAEELEGVINQIDGTFGKQDEERYTKLNALFMTFLADRHGIAAPSHARDEIDRE